MRRWLTWVVACAFLLFHLTLAGHALAASPSTSASPAAAGPTVSGTSGQPQAAERDEDDEDEEDEDEGEDDEDEEDQERQHGLEQALKALERLAKAAAATGQPEAVDAILQQLAARIQEALAAGDASAVRQMAETLKDIVDELIDEADEDDPQDTARLMAAAGLSVATGALDAALAALRAAAERDSDNPEVYAELAAVRRKLGGEGILAFVKGKELAFDVQPLLEQNRVLVPVRAVGQALGADVSYDPRAKTVTIRQGAREAVLAVGRPVAWVDGREVGLDVSAQVVKGRLMLPLRFIAEVFGVRVQWLADQQAIVITR